MATRRVTSKRGTDTSSGRGGSGNGFGNQIKPNAGRKETKSYSFTDKNMRAAGLRRVLELGNCEKNPEEEEHSSSGIVKSLNETGLKAFLRTSETKARNNAESRIWRLFWYDGIAAILVILKHLITIESCVSAILSSITTWILYTYHADWDARGDGEKPQSYGKSMSFLILTFFIIMPITTLLRLTYQRRELSLQHICKLKACAMAIYQCHATWTWNYKDGAKQLNRLEHSDDCLQLLIDFGDTITRFLTLPMTGYPRHRELNKGRHEEELTMAAAYSLFETAIGEYGTKLGLLTERMKECGFSASESSRVRQSERMLLEAAEYLREGKLYRTPQSMNALIIVFAVIGPAFYAPMFAQIGHEVGTVWFGVVYAAIISLAITALYEAVKLMEDPFVCYISIDGIDVYEELSIVYYFQLLRARSTIFPDAPPFGSLAATGLGDSASTTTGKTQRSTIHRRSSTRISSYSLILNGRPSSKTSTMAQRENTQNSSVIDLEAAIMEEFEEGHGTNSIG